MNEHKWLTERNVNRFNAEIEAAHRTGFPQSGLGTDAIERLIDDWFLRAIAHPLGGAALASIPRIRYLVAEAVEWEAAVNGLACVFGISYGEARERFTQRMGRSVLSWRDLIWEIRRTGEL